ncbi:MAG: amino acid adenylation domain-containing protein [Acidobacteria bacterium]|nr:amino acid adenylation domain-containing protein [Acidobacteriota bacterium]
MSTPSEGAKRMSVIKRTLLAMEQMQSKLDAVERARTEPIAIIAMGCRFPGGAKSPDAYWDLLERGVDAISDVPPDRWNVDEFYHPDPATPGKMSGRWGGFLDKVDEFDAGFFGISPREAARMDPQQRLLLEVAWEALEDAGQPAESLAGSPTGVFVGSCATDYSWLQFADPSQIDAYTGTGTSLSILAGRLSYLLDLRGPSVSLDTACSSSLVAVHMACQSLRSRECNMALAGGVNVILSPLSTICMSQMRMMAADGRCKTFDARADGFVRGEGCGVVVLKRVSDALTDGDPIVALIRGSAVNGDGRSVGLTAPNGLSQQAVITQALRNAGVSPSQLSYVETHGTGTSLGDPIEIEALASAIGPRVSENHRCAIGSVKTNLGHLEAAAGIAGLIKVALSLKHKTIPPILHFSRLNPNISLEGTPFVIPTEPMAWPNGSERRLAGQSAFGWSGTNAHVILEEAPVSCAIPADGAGSTDGAYLVPISAQSAEALETLAHSYRHFLSAEPAGLPALADIAFTASVRRTHHEYRLAVVGSSHAAVAEHISAYLQGEARPGLSSGHREVQRRRKLVFVFPGQGGQWVGMARDLLAQEPVFRSALEQCEQALRPYVDWSLLEVLTTDCSPSPHERIDVIQPAIFAIQVALAALWRAWGFFPDAVVGHSMGEVAAACVAGALSVEDAARVLSRRSQLLRRTSGQGAMAVVELSLEQAGRELTGYTDLLAIAASNSPKATVLSGDPTALDAFLETLQQRGVFCRPVKVDVASHSPQMDILREDLLQALDGLQPRPGAVPIYSTVTGRVSDGGGFDPGYWVKNLREPVLFAPAIDRLAADGYDVFLELSPHPTLSVAIQENLTHRGSEGTVLPSLRREEPARSVLLGTLGAFYTLGYPIDWRRLYPRRGRCVGLPSYPWQRERFWHAPRAAVNGSASALSWQGRADTGRHPLIGRKLALALPAGQQVWESYLDIQTLSYLSDHRIQGTVVLPGTGYVEMALAAAAEVFGPGPRVLTDITFRRLLFLPEGCARIAQVVMRSDAQGATTFEVHSRPAEGDSSECAWTLHATGTIQQDQLSSTPAALDPLKPDEVRARCPLEMPGKDFYLQSAARGNEWGPCFQGITRLWRGEREALGELQVPALLEPELDRYQIHPALLDAYLHTLGTTVPVETIGRRGTFVPIHLDQVRAHSRPSTLRLWSHAVLRPSAQSGVAVFDGDIRLYDETGQPVVEFIGLRIQGLDPDAQRFNEESPDNWLYEIQWQPKVCGGAAEHPTDSSSFRIIFGDDSGVGEELAAKAEAQGERYVLVTSGDAYERIDEAHVRVRQGNREDLRQLLRGIADQDRANCRGIFHLWSLDAAAPGQTTTSSVVKAQERGPGTAILLTQELVNARWRELPRLWLVTRGAQSVESRLRPMAPAQSPLWGLGRTIALEQPALWGGLVDLDPGAPATENASRLWDAVARSDGEDQLAFRQGQRYVARLARRDRKDDLGRRIEWRSDASYLVTGGLGGLGLLVARWMVEHGAQHVILMGRTALPPRFEWKERSPEGQYSRVISAVLEIEALGAEVHLASVDVADEAQLHAFLLAWRADDRPPIRGVVHAAGVVELKALQELDLDGLQRVLRPKVLGAWLLHSLLADVPLDFFVLFSSGASLLSSPFLGSYAAGNAFLDALAHHRRAAGLEAMSINWGFWSEVGLAARFQQQAGQTSPAPGMGSFSPAEGLEMLDRLLSENPVQVGVMPINWREWRRHHPAAAESPLLSGFPGDAPSVSPRAARHQDASGLAGEAILKARPEERGRLVSAFLGKHLARVLKLSESKLDLSRPVNKLGLDSLMAIELKNFIESELGVVVPVVAFLQGPSVTQLAETVLEHLIVRDFPQTSLPTQDRTKELPTIVPAFGERHEPFPLNDIQQAYWIGRSNFFELGNVAAHIYLELDSTGLDLERLTGAWQRIVERHPMLRVVILPDGRQQIQEHVPPYQIQCSDMRGEEPELISARLETIRQDLSHEVRRTDRWPLFEIRASRLEDRRIRLHLSFDIMIADIWSLQILLREWSQLYHDQCTRLSPLDLSFRDYTLAASALESSESFRRSLEYWRNRVPTLPPAPDLPLAKSPASIERPRFIRRTAKLEPNLWNRLKDRASQAGLTPSGILLAAFAEILSTWSRNPRFTINVTLFNRLPIHPQVNEIVGDFTSVNLLAVDATGPDDFERRATNLQRQLWEDLEHSQVSGVRVLRELTRTQGGLPGAVMPVVFTSTLTNLFAQSAETLPLDWLGQRVYGIAQTPQVWIDHQVFEQSGALVFNWDAVEELFPHGMLDDMFESYSRFLRRLAEEESTWHETERHLVPPAQLELRSVLNRTDAPVSAELLHRLFEQKADQTPQHLAVIAPGRRLTYEELSRRSRQVGRLLRKMGARPNTLVAVVMEKGWEQVVAVLGVLSSGAAYLPIDPGLPIERVHYLLENGEVELAVTQPWLSAQLEWPDRVSRLVVDDVTHVDVAEAPLAPVQGPDDLAYVIYTSGSTGRPKGVMIDHRGAVNTVLDMNERFSVGPDDRVLAISSLNFDLSVYDIFGLLAAGGTVVLPGPAATRDPALWSEMMRREQVTIWNSVPALMQLLVEHAVVLPEALPRSLRLVLLSGDWIPLALPDQIKTVAERVSVVSLGGATEASIWSILYPIEQSDPDWKSVPYGRPMRNQRFHVLDERLDPCPEWLPGQLYIGGVGLAKGYWRDPEKTSASFFVHPRTGERLYRTGDLGRYLPDGNIEFLGREDFQVKIQGYRIELGEVEATLEQHPAVRSAVVAAFGEPRGNRRLVGYVVPNPDQKSTIAELRRFLQSRLPEYMVPSLVVPLASLPLSPNGKVDRKALPAPSMITAPAKEGAAAERSPIANRIAELIARVVKADHIDPDANLLDLGTSSVEMIRIASLLEKELGFRPKIDEFYRNPTIEGLVESYDQQRALTLFHEEERTTGGSQL